MDKLNPKVSIIFISVFVLALSRIMPHWPNFTAIGAAAIFGGAMIKNSYQAVLVPIIALFISDLIINNTIYSGYYEGFVLFGQSSTWIYASFILMSVIAHFSIKGFKVAPILGNVLISTLLFFVLTNFGAWLGSTMYTKDISGLLLAFEAGLPFVLNSLFANLLFSGVLFGAYYIALEKKLTWLFIK